LIWISTSILHTREVKPREAANNWEDFSFELSPRTIRYGEFPYAVRGFITFKTKEAGQKGEPAGGPTLGIESAQADSAFGRHLRLHPARGVTNQLGLILRFELFFEMAPVGVHRFDA
jgi:hypothetical protein